MTVTLADVGLAWQLFADDEIVEDATGCVRRMNPAVKHPANPVFLSPDPVQRRSFSVWSVLFDEEEDLFKMWYRSQQAEGDIFIRYATSKDGLRWECPELGLFEWAGSKRNNILSDPSVQPFPTKAWIYRNPDRDEKARKYVGLFQTWHYYLGWSPDGIHWDFDFDHIAWERGCGDGLGECFFAMYDPLIATWRGYPRVWTETNSIRTSGYGESEDLTSWTGPEVNFRGDDEWGLGAQIYAWVAWKDAGLYWGLPMIYFTDMHPDPRRMQTMQPGLVFSRDGQRWEAIDKSQFYIPLGELDQFDSQLISQNPEPILRGDEVRFYYTGSNRKHDDAVSPRVGCLGLAIGRRGGYACLQPDGEGEGVMMSKPFRLRGDRLFLNARAHKGGSVAAEFLNPHGQVIETLDLAQSCDAFTGDSTDHPMTWRGDGSLGRILGETVRLRLRFREAQVFGFRLGESKPGICELSEGPAPVRCGTTASPPVIDGQLDDTDWENFKILGTAGEFVYHNRLEPAPVRTTVLAMHDAEAIYLGFDLEEPNIGDLRTSCVQGAMDLYKDDCVQVELQPDGLEGLVTVLFFNPKAVRAQNRFDPTKSHWNQPNPTPTWQVATKVARTRWTAELKVPFASLGLKPPRAGDSWRFNVHRFRFAGEQPEVHSWVCVFGAFWRHDRRGELHFE